MTDDSELTHWLASMTHGDQRAIQRIWEHYYHPLIAVARKKLGNLPRRMIDEEDVVLSAFNSFCAAVAAGRFPELRDRDDLWRLLVTITGRKAVAQLRWIHYQKRGGGEVRGDSALLRPGDSDEVGGFEEVMGDEPSPDFAAAVNEQFSLLLDSLDDPSLSLLAVLKLEGYTNEEIARAFDCAVTTVERKLHRIRKKWQRSSGQIEAES